MGIEIGQILENGTRNILLDYGFDEDEEVIEEIIVFVLDKLGLDDERSPLRKWEDDREESNPDE